MNKKKNNSDDAILGRLERVSTLLSQIGPEVLGHRVKRLRDQHGLSIRDVAERASLSKNSIVRLEQGRGTQPVTVLKVCSVFGVHIERLAEPTADDVIAVTHRRKDDRWIDVGDMGSERLAQVGSNATTEKERRKSFPVDALAPANLLRCRLPGGTIVPSVLEISQKTPERSHVGEEMAYVLSGEAIITVGRKKHKLKAGEAVTFWSAEPHSYAPADLKNVPVRILSIRVDG